jgi:DNA repair protein RadC
MGRRYTIKELPPELRPRERLLAEGPEALSSAELLGILFGFGSKEKTAVELASELISENGDLFGLYGVSMQVPKYKTNTKQSGVSFNAFLGDGTREVRFEWGMR